jgi:hypothetical protein
MTMFEILQTHRNAQHQFPRLFAWDCSETEISYIGWGEMDEQMIPKYKWEDGKVVFFDTNSNSPLSVRQTP